MTRPKPQSNGDWFVIAVPANEAFDIADGYARAKDTWLQEIAAQAKDFIDYYGIDDE